MRALLLLLSMIPAVPLCAQESEGDGQTIVITGTPLAQTERHLAECIARKCPPKEDIDASLAHAENLFLAGEYADSRRTLDKARGRNKRFAAMLPLDVSDLLRARGRLNDLDGRVGPARLSQIESLETLSAGFGKADSRVFMQRLMVGDEFARAGRLQAAEDVYGRVEQQARKAGQIRVAGIAMLRDAIIHAAVASVQPQFKSTAERKIARVEKSREPELAEHRDAARLLRAQLAAFGGDAVALDRALAAIAPRPPEKPVLIFSPPLMSSDSRGEQRITAATSGEPQWADVRFRIARDGTVSNIETLRASANLSGRWLEEVNKALPSRRYAPLALPNDREGVMRVERFSYVHDLSRATGSRIAGRSFRGRITSLDITAQEPAS